MIQCKRQQFTGKNSSALCYLTTQTISQKLVTTITAFNSVSSPLQLSRSFSSLPMDQALLLSDPGAVLILSRQAVTSTWEFSVLTFPNEISRKEGCIFWNHLFVANGLRWGPEQVFEVTPCLPWTLFPIIRLTLLMKQTFDL
ncbi:hypothetical protein AVEN_46183-1 [Araneus ventricosus]|uniref:Uncharacterized protein n=1 Tax=Araneus ventricosus TaxID=182803 RepID=A0A4Y2E6A1_ARAVE|nr:hypothetical protein AVEN_46183-1 [Araneus ventricosus]